MDPHSLKKLRRQRRQGRVRRRVASSPDRPRLAVFRSEHHMYAQIIDDTKGCTLVASSSLDKDLRAQLKSGCNRAAAELVGKELGRRAAQAGIKRVTFDRRHYKYHGRVKALADAVRQAGIEF